MKHFVRHSVLAATALLATAVSAAPETYVAEPGHTFVYFSYSHFGYSNQNIRLNKTDATITIDRAAKTGLADVTVDLSSVDSGTALDEHIQGEDFFNGAKYKTAQFKSTQFNFTGDKPSSIDGILTLKGISKPVTLTLSSFHCMPHPMVKKDACGANASVVVKRSDFNMSKYVPYVSDEVTITIAIEAIKQ